jgi:hypothetical protein
MGKHEQVWVKVNAEVEYGGLDVSLRYLLHADWTARGRLGNISCLLGCPLEPLPFCSGGLDGFVQFALGFP